MTFPFESLAGSSREAGLVVAVLIGLAFGFVLERAGFGRAPKLAAQFYLRDMTVFKVMFTAIVTAMLGLVAVSTFGLADLRSISESIVSWTYIWPMLVGGLVLGVGFIVSGYCPGTSAVAAASGNIDGLAAFGGVIAGTFVYSELLRIESFARFHESGERGAWFLYDLVRIPPALIAIAIAVMALGAFAGAEKVEAWIAARPRSADVQATRPAWRRFAVPAFGVLAAMVAVALAVPDRATAITTREPQRVEAAAFAPRVIAEPWRYRIDGDLVTDMRTGTVWRVAGGTESWTRQSAAPATQQLRRPTGTIAKPKKKGGGCSS